jgi:type 1 glutamine amidotransferase
MKKAIELSALLLAAFMLLPACKVKSEPRVLIFAKTKGFYHESIPKGMAILMDLCERNMIPADTTRDASVFTIDNLKRYNVVVFLNTTGDVLDSLQQEAFKQYIHSGGGFLGIHAATDTEYDWPWYNLLVGAYFLSHPQQQEAVIRVVEKGNPATSMLPDNWKRKDEWYNFRNINPDIRVLAYLDETSYKGGENGKEHPFIWCHEFEGGRAFYTGCGHRDDNYDEPLMQQHLLGAIKWAGKLK